MTLCAMNRHGSQPSRSLLVESILAGLVQSGQYLSGYEGYDRLFRAIGELPHQSCAIHQSGTTAYDRAIADRQPTANSIDDVLCRQLERLSESEQQLIYWLALEREPVTGVELRSNLVLHTRASGEIINALQSLSRRCIIVNRERNWSISPVMIAYIIGTLAGNILNLIIELEPNSRSRFGISSGENVSKLYT
ncbi:MAG: hypothetical protein LH613_01685 [Chamaesiphon sp.]|nr:hypothetical protein [Chamaesiphon sp.]